MALQRTGRLIGTLAGRHSKVSQRPGNLRLRAHGRIRTSNIKSIIFSRRFLTPASILVAFVIASTFLLYPFKLKPKKSDLDLNPKWPTPAKSPVDIGISSSLAIEDFGLQRARDLVHNGDPLHTMLPRTNADGSKIAIDIDPASRSKFSVSVVGADGENPIWTTKVGETERISRSGLPLARSAVAIPNNIHAFFDGEGNVFVTIVEVNSIINDTRVFKLDGKTGRFLWDKPAKFFEGEFGVTPKGNLVVSWLGGNLRKYIRILDGKTGQVLRDEEIAQWVSNINPPEGTPSYRSMPTLRQLPNGDFILIGKRFTITLDLGGY